MSESASKRDREHRYKCGTGRSPNTLKGQLPSNENLNAFSNMNGDGSVDATDWP